MIMMAISTASIADTPVTEPKVRQSPKTGPTVGVSISVVDPVLDVDVEVEDVDVDDVSPVPAVPVGGPILDIDVEVEDTDVEDDVSTVPAVPVGGCVGPMCAIMHNDAKKKK